MTSTATDSAGLHGLDVFAQRIAAGLAAALQLPVADVKLERPRQEKLGDFAFPCFRVAKAQGGNPAELAGRLASELAIESVQAAAAGPFLNFTIERGALAQAVLATASRADYGSAESSDTTLVEYSSPNIAKPMHVGHLRSTIIGAALARIYERLGHAVVRLNHLGDWGSQFGKLVAAWNRWGDEAALEAGPIDHLLALYVRYHELAEPGEDQEPGEEGLALQQEAKDAFRELESGTDGPTREIWRRFTALSLREFDAIYSRLGATFDHLRGESWYEAQLDPTFAWLQERGVLEESKGAQIIDLSSEGIETPSLVKTAHGTTLYATRDIAAARSRWEEFTFDRCLYVVGNEQRLHFEQLKASLRRCGCDWSERLEHIPFGLIRFPEGKLSTRKGRVLRLGEVLDRAVEMAAGIVEEKNPALAGKQEVAEQVGVGAVMFHDLKHQRMKDVVFDWKEVLSFEGDTGPYVQYTHARFCSILRKAEREIPTPDAVDATLLADSPEMLVALGRFPGALRETAEKREPMLLAQALLKIAAAGNAFYHDKRVLGEEPALEAARLAAIDALRNTLAIGLGLLGVPAPDEM